jgi:hypothetical protein
VRHFRPSVRGRLVYAGLFASTGESLGGKRKGPGDVAGAVDGITWKGQNCTPGRSVWTSHLSRLRRIAARRLDRGRHAGHDWLNGIELPRVERVREAIENDAGLTAN